MDKKLQKARTEMIKKLSSEKRSSLHEGLGKQLGEKKGKLQKVEVSADSKEGLEEGLSMAQKLMKARFGEKLEKGETPTEADLESAVEGDEEHSEGCDFCKDEGCALCSEDEESTEE